MLDALEIKNLREAARQSFSDYKPFRDQYRRFIKYYVGREYNKEENSDPVPLPNFKLLVSVLGSYLSPSDPQALVTAGNGGDKAEALDVEANLNHDLRRLKVGETIRRCVDSGLFLMGAVKVGRTGQGFVDDDGVERNAPETYVKRISFDNLIVDSRAGEDSGYAYIGDRYSMSLRKAQEIPWFDESVRAKLKSTDYRESWLDGGNASDRTDNISTDKSKASEDFEPMCEFVDFYIPSRRVMVTLSASDETLPALAQLPYEGPNEGPYITLSYGDVPDNFVPLSPMAALFELHSLDNALWVKLARQGRGQKTIWGVQGIGDEDAKRATAAPDRAVIPVQSPSGIVPLNFPGVDAPTLAFAMQVHEATRSDLFNLQSLAGLGPQSQTVGQDRQIAQQANKIVEDMAKDTQRFSDKIIRAVAWNIFHDPVRLYETKRKVKNTRLETIAVFNPEMAMSDFFGYNYSIDPYSERHSTPSDRWNNIMSMLQTFAPFMQQMAAQGISMKFDELIRLYARYSGMSELEDIVVFMNPQLPGEGSGEGPTKSPVSHRVYERLNRPGATQQGANKVMMSQLLAGGGGKSPLAGAA